MDQETVYVSVNMNKQREDKKTFKSDKVFEFLKIIKNYLKKLPIGDIILELGISGPIKRIIFGGDFGCNLLDDTDVCRKFQADGMTLYTMPNNANAFRFQDARYENEVNHKFVIDVDLVSAPQPPLVVGGGVGGGKDKARGHGGMSTKRINIGECITATDSKNKQFKRKTRRKIPLSLQVIKKF